MSSVHVDHRFKDAGDAVVLLGPLDTAAVDGSEYQKRLFGRVEGRVPDVDLALEKALQRVVRRAIAAGVVKSAHDCAEGGLGVALAECCLASGVTGGAQTAAPPPARGAAIVLETTMRDDIALFGEGPSRIVVTCAPERLAELRALVADDGEGIVPLAVLGSVDAGGRLRITAGGEELVDLPVDELLAAYESLPARLG